MLSERRKADRQQMAEILVALAAEHGATATSYPMPPRSVYVDIEAPSGLTLLLDFDGQSYHTDTHVLAWCIHKDSDARLKLGAFGDGSVNEFHQRKATQVAKGFEELRRMIADGLSRAAAGSIYENVAI